MKITLQQFSQIIDECIASTKQGEKKQNTYAKKRRSWARWAGYDCGE